ncbi:MAG: pyridoxal-phosphate dependent enzyme [Patescibacteria group bacterium]|nr:pyridoxal-phosphate dependent enzyme [Patescibacteria group bacterium]
MAIYRSITEVIGNTPLLLLDPKKTGIKNIEIYAKLEYLNPFGSIKDRTAFGMIKEELPRLKKESRKIIEASSGNTIKALAGLANLCGLSSVSVTNRIRVPEIKEILLLMGVEIIETPGRSACLDPNNPDDPLYVINKMILAEPDKYFYPNQYHNENNPAIHEQTTAQEILRDLGSIDYLFASLGTTGSSLGLFRALKKENPRLKIFGIAASAEDFIPGIRSQGELLEVGLFEPEIYEEIIYVSSLKALEAMRELIINFGILAGPSSGSVYFAAKNKLSYLNSETSGKKAVIITCDRFEWYLSYIKKRKPEWFGLKKKAHSPYEFEFDENFPYEIESENLLEFIQKNEPLVIDLRSPFAFQLGHLPESINIEASFFAELVDDRRPFSIKKPLLLVCAIGVVSKRLAAYLRTLGYESYSLKYGLNSFEGDLESSDQ